MSNLELIHRPILVTGAHRSGTTWVGKMLSASKEAAYISEPLNVFHRPGVMRYPVKRWYTYICPDNEQQYLPALSETLSYRYHLLEEVRSLHSIKDILRMIRDLSSFQIGRFRGQRPLLKDPFAVFSTSWFAQRLDCQVVLTVRHPAAVASSLKRLNWSFDFSDLTSQRFLMRDWLEPYRSQMEAIGADDVIGQSCLLWCMIYQVVDAFRGRFPEFRIVRLEDLSKNPLEGYRTLYTSLGLKFTTGAQNIVLRSSSPRNPPEPSTSSAHTTSINSRSSLSNWKRRLATAEIDRIRSLTEDVANAFYHPEDWK